MSGIFISRGMTITIPQGGFSISIDQNGTSASEVTFHVHFDVSVTWCELAVAHATNAKACQSAREAAWSAGDANAQSSTLEREFEASMQAAMAAAIAIDAFYAVILTHIHLPDKLAEQWRIKRTPRYAQATEVLRRAFRLKPAGVKLLRQLLKEIYRFRDLAVHPSGKIQAPILHPELNVGVEWRFAFFRASNAEALVDAATGIIWDLTRNGKPINDGVCSYSETVKERLAPLYPNGHPKIKTVEQPQPAD
jgi:hypothetical protein